MTDDVRKMIEEEKAKDNVENISYIQPKEEKALPKIQPTNEQLLDVLKNPENAVALKVSEKVGNLIETDDKVKATVDKTAKQVIDDTSDAISHKSGKLSDDAFFERHKADLENGGIKEPTERWYMERVKKVSTFWKKVWFIVFGWWVIGLGTWADQIKPLRKPLKVIAYVGGVLILLAVIAGIILSVLKVKNII